MLVIGIDPSTTETGIVALDYHTSKVVDMYAIDAREKRFGKNGNELKTKGKFKIDLFCEIIHDFFDYISYDFSMQSVIIVLPKMSGALNYNTIDKLSKLCGIIHGIAKKYSCFYIYYINENSARSRVLKNVEGETYKEKAMKLSGFDNDNLADAYVLAKSFVDYNHKGKELFKEF